MDRVVALALAAASLAGCASREDDRIPPRPANVAPRATADLGRIDTAVRRYARDHAGRLPTSLADLTTEPTPDGGSYLRRVDADPWGQPYDYAIKSSRAGTYDLRSYGADRLPGTLDDLVTDGVVPRPD